MKSMNDDARGLPETGLPDLTEIPLRQYLSAGQNALKNTVRRVVEEVERAEGNYAAHGSSPAP